MKEVYQEKVSQENMDWHNYHLEKDGVREARNKLAKEVWDVETEELIEECYL